MKKYLLLALLSGILLSCAWPTAGFPLLVFVAFVPLLTAEYLIRKQHTHTTIRVALFSYLSFLIWNISTTWWLVYASVFGALFAILVNSFLMMLVFLGFHFIARRTSQKKAFVFLIASWILFEKLHLCWDLSWPWLNLGNVFSESVHWIQWYEYTGSFGGTLWVWTVNVLVYIALTHFTRQSDKKELLVGLSRALLMIAIPIIVSLFMYRKPQQFSQYAKVIVLQPNIDPYQEKYQLSNMQIGQLLMKLSQSEVDKEVDFIIAPETTFAQPIRLSEIHSDNALSLVSDFVEKHPHISVITGVSLIDFFSDKRRITPQSNFLSQYHIWYNDYNSALLIRHQHPWELYHKSKLVVGVENFPYKSVFPPFLKSLMIDLGGTVALKTTQDYRSVFSGVNPQMKAAPIICYESVYGEFVTEYVRNGANFLAILTNDSWWDNTQGHKQLLSYARLRAIETRRSIARSANCGISAFINPKGELIDSLSYETQGALKAVIPLNNELTFYTRYGDYLARIAGFLWIFIVLTSLLRKREVLRF